MDRFFGVGGARGFAGVAFFDERVEVDHFGMGVESVKDRCASNAFWEGGYGGVGDSFRHGGRGELSELMRFDEQRTVGNGTLMWMECDAVEDEE